MGGGWSSDFSYAYLRQLLRAARSNFEVCLLSDTLRVVKASERPALFLRHDVDVCLRRALRMAEIEHELGVRATYMLMTDSPLYALEDDASKQIIRRLATMGHEIGLHYNPDEGERTGDRRVSAWEARIDSACEQLEKVSGLPVASISFHRPPAQCLQGPLTVNGRVNAYASQLMDWYLSDSKGYWREGEPLPHLLRPRKLLLQLLLHPIWWGAEHMRAEDRLQVFFKEQTRGQSPLGADHLDAMLTHAIPAVRRSGSKSSLSGNEDA